MTLHFKDMNVGFSLNARDKTLQYNEGSFELGLLEYAVDENNNIDMFVMTFIDEKNRTEADCIELELGMPDYAKVPGSYSVPELKVDNLPFIDVMKAVSKYYIDKKKAA